ncbi:MAG: TerC family protein [Alphaproteobacteria bacterium]|nr:TerC family protein [Alphaproteobacteria bacterium]
MLSLLASPEAWASLATLSVLEIVLGIDNIIFVSIAANKLDAARRPAARRIGLSLALILRVALLSAIAWIIHLSEPVLNLWGVALSWRDLVFGVGGLFLLTKSTREIHGLVEGEEEAARGTGASMIAVILQIALFDIVFSLDSVVTAVGMVEDLAVMIAAVVIAMLVMLAAADPVAGFVERHPTVKMLALSFLLLIGTALVADAAHFHIPRGYLYFAVAFSGLVEALNQAAAKKRAKG